MSTAQPQNFVQYSTGRRKTSVARVFIRTGGSRIQVNGRTLNDYFGRETRRMLVRQPLVISKLENSVDVWVTVRGGGNSGQAEAIRHGLARALAKHKPEVARDLRTAGLLTRDARKVERKKIGLHKARKALQYSKR